MAVSEAGVGEGVLRGGSGSGTESRLTSPVEPVSHPRVLRASKGRHCVFMKCKMDRRYIEGMRCSLLVSESRRSRIP